MNQLTARIRIGLSVYLILSVLFVLCVTAQIELAGVAVFMDSGLG